MCSVCQLIYKLLRTGWSTGLGCTRPQARTPPHQVWPRPFIKPSVATLWQALMSQLPRDVIRSIQESNMAAAMELRCWGGDWGLPSVHTECLIVLSYAKFSGAKVTVSPIDWTWKTLTATVPELLCGDTAIQEPTHILNFLRKQRFNADYDLTARQGADTMAYIALLEEKLRPALLHTFWVDAENYANLTRPWFASRSPFPLNFLVPSRHANTALSRILLTRGEAPLHRITEVEGKIYSDAKECLNLLSYRLGTANYFFGNSPTSLDAFVFGFVAPLHKASLPSSPLQSHFRQLDNLMRFCDSILAVYFSSDHPYG